MYYDKKGNSYRYLDVFNNGTKVYHNGLFISEERKENIDKIISRAWDNLSDEIKFEINQKIEKMRAFDNNK